MVLKAARWVDLENGEVDRNIFYDQEIYQQELELVFARSWLFVGHDKTNQLHVFLNSCRHRGNAVTRANLGACATFMCTYHGWSYDLEGKLVGIPGFKELYHDGLNRGQWGLIEAPKVESFHGLIFANWDRTAPDLLEYMGDYAWFLETRADPQGQGSELNGGIFKWTMDHNWKFAADNFVGDGYHAAISHKSATIVGHRGVNQATQGVQNEDEAARWERQSDPDTFRLTTKYGHGAGLTLRKPDAPAVAPDVPEPLASYYRERLAAMERRMGPNRARLNGFNALFPNFSINSSADQIHVWHPRGPLHTESWVYMLVDRAASPEVKELLVKEASRHFGPTGMFEQDDSDNWRLSTGGAKSVVGRRYPLNYSMGLRYNDWMEPKEDLPLRRRGALGDTNQLNFYRHWQDMMAGKSWPELQRLEFERV